MASRWVDDLATILPALVTLTLIATEALWSKSFESATASVPSLVRLAQPPSATVEFLHAYSLGDEVSADELTSPLYRAEWERRGLSSQERTQIDSPSHQPGQPFEERLRFSFVGGILDAQGFGHLLFSGKPAVSRSRPMLSVWRVDVDAEGKVIWLEIVWLFGENVQTLRAVRDPNELSRVTPIRPGVVPLLGIASSDGQEAYYVYGLGPKGSSQATTDAPTVVGFYAVDSSHELRPGAWTFGADEQGLSEYGKPRSSGKALRIDARERALLDAYLKSIA